MTTVGTSLIDSFDSYRSSFSQDLKNVTGKAIKASDFLTEVKAFLEVEERKFDGISGSGIGEVKNDRRLEKIECALSLIGNNREARGLQERVQGLQELADREFGMQNRTSMTRRQDGSLELSQRTFSVVKADDLKKDIDSAKKTVSSDFERRKAASAVSGKAAALTVGAKTTIKVQGSEVDSEEALDGKIRDLVKGISAKKQEALIAVLYKNSSGEDEASMETMIDKLSDAHGVGKSKEEILVSQIKSFCTTTTLITAAANLSHNAQLDLNKQPTEIELKLDPEGLPLIEVKQSDAPVSQMAKGKKKETHKADVSVVCDPVTGAKAETIVFKKKASGLSSFFSACLSSSETTAKEEVADHKDAVYQRKYELLSSTKRDDSLDFGNMEHKIALKSVETE